MNGEKVSANILLDQDVQILNIDDKSVLQIDIPRASYHFRPVYINGNPFKGTFRRITKAIITVPKMKCDRCFRTVRIKGWMEPC